MTITKKQVMDKLAQVLDPELNIAITDLGLVYEVAIKENKVRVLMTLTTIGCPLFPLIEQEIKNKLQEVGIKDRDMRLKLTFDPPWSMERLSERAKAKLGI